MNDAPLDLDGRDAQNVNGSTSPITEERVEDHAASTVATVGRDESAVQGDIFEEEFELPWSPSVGSPAPVHREELEIDPLFVGRDETLTPSIACQPRCS